MKKEKTIHELAKEYPDKSYRDMEKYRDADRMEEAQRVPMTESRQKQEELEPIEGEEGSLKKELGACITAGMQRDREATDKMKNRPLTDTMDEIAYYELKRENDRLKKRVQEAEGETSIVKGIGQASPEMKKAKERIAELDNSLSIALEINEEHQRYNGKLQSRLTELEEENKKLQDTLNNKLEDVRKAGL